MREGDVPRLLCDVNPHDALHHRVKGALGAQIALLDVVDGLLTAEDAHEEDHGSVQAASPRNGAARRMIGPNPGTSVPVRLINSWNIRVWLHSSITSWVQ